MYIPAAATWIRHAGDTIRKLCVDIERGATCGTLEPGCTWEWKGENGFSIERWQFWKRKFGELAAEQSLDEHLRSMAKESRGKKWTVLTGPEHRHPMFCRRSSVAVSFKKANLTFPGLIINGNT